MALNDVTISLDLAQLLGGDIDTRRTRVYVSTNVPNNTLIDTSTGQIRLGDEKVTVETDGTGSFTTWGVGADGNPTSWQTTVTVEYARVGARDRQIRTFGPFTITDADDGKTLAELEDQQAVPPNYQTTFTASMETIRDEAEAARDAAVDISNIDTSDAVVEALVLNTGGAGPLTSAALSASIGEQLETPATPASQAIAPLRPKKDRTRTFGTIRTLATGTHNAFAYAVELPNTSYLVAWRKGANHTPSQGSIYAARYDVFGDTAMAPTLVKAHATLDLRDPCLTVLADGRVLMSWFLYDPAGAGAPIPDSLRVAFSSDNGATWSSDILAPTALTGWAAAAGPVEQLADGTLLLPAYGSVTGQTWQSARLSRSTDNGATWSAGAMIADETIDSRHWQEPNILLTSRGDLLAAIRTEGASGDTSKQTIWTARSTDGGLTWTDHTDQFAGSGAPRLTELNGVIYAVYRDRATGRPAQRASLDFGTTWEAATELPHLAGVGMGSMVYGNAVAYRNDSLRYWYTLQSADTLTADLITVDAVVPDDRRVGEPVACRVRNTSGAQSVPNAAWTAITFAAEDIDTSGMHSTSTNPSRVTAPVTGYYHVDGVIYWASGSPTQVQAAIRKNGSATALPGLRGKVNPTSGQDSIVRCAGVVLLNAGDYIELYGYQDSGAALNARYEDTVLSLALTAPRV